MVRYAKSNASHYIKWKLTDDLSLRFYFLFQDRKNYENKYFLKSHSKKDYQEITSLTIVEELIKASFDQVEVMGRTIDGKYVKCTGTFGTMELDLSVEDRDI